jgi:hypothetical protein
MIKNTYRRTTNLAGNIVTFSIIKSLNIFLEYKRKQTNFNIEKAYYINARNANLSFARIYH